MYINQTNEESTELLTCEEATEVLRCGYNTLYRLLKEERIPAFRLGKTWKIPAGGIYRFIRSQSNM